MPKKITNITLVENIKSNSANEVLEGAKDKFDSVLILGWDEKDGKLRAVVSDGLTNTADVTYLLERYKYLLMSGGMYDVEED